MSARLLLALFSSSCFCSNSSLCRSSLTKHLTRATHGDPAGANVPPRPVMVMGTYQPPYEVLTEPERAAAAALGWDTYDFVTES